MFFHPTAHSDVHLLLLSHFFRAAVTVDDAGLVMDSAGDSGVIVSIEHMHLESLILLATV